MMEVLTQAEGAVLVRRSCRKPDDSVYVRLCIKRRLRESGAVLLHQSGRTKALGEPGVFVATRSTFVSACHDKSNN
jgi:hypothetical protein